MMIKFPSIDSFRHVFAHVKRQSEYHGKPLPTIVYEGRVKLHGTNAGIHYIPDNTVHVMVENEDTSKPLRNAIRRMFGKEPIMRTDFILRHIDAELRAQSRERNITPGKNDNAGFAGWVEENKKFLMDFLDITFEGKEVTIYGEWCGGNIQKGVALNQLPKMFVVFGYVDHSENWIDSDGNERGILRSCPFFSIKQPPSKLGIEGVVDEFEKEYNDSLIDMYHIDQVSPVTIQIDFNNPNEAVQKMEELTAKYEEECPWAKMWGVSGIGEGLVWTPASIYNPDSTSSKMVFKTKGDKHGNPASKNKVKVAVEPERMEDFNELIEKILPLWRLKQGITVLDADLVELTKANTGHFLKWIATDVMKEERDTIEASGFPEKVVMGEVSKRARQFYFNHTED